MCIRVLDWYDGPVLWLEKRSGKTFICMREAEDWYLAAQVTPDEKAMFLKGKLDLRTIYETHPCYAFLPCFDYPVYVFPLTKDKITEKFFPAPGYFYRQEECGNVKCAW